jgi:ABC-type glycerol-3-phosphate transport system permease component
MTGFQLSKRGRNILFYGLVVVFVLIVLLPIYYIFLTAFVSGPRLFTQPLTYFPTNLSFERFSIVLESLPLWRYLFNTVFLAVSSALIALLICLLAAYAIARLDFPGANLVLIGLLASSMLPPFTTVIPLFQMYQSLKLMNTLHGLLILYVSGMLPVTTWVFVSFIRQIPGEIEDAARVDGAELWQLLRHITIPLLRPGMVTMFLINFIAGWNEFFTPLIFSRGVESKVITMALTEAQSIGSSTQFYQNWGNMSAVAILATVPVFLLTLFFQRQITDGISSGAIK